MPCSISPCRRSCRRLLKCGHRCLARKSSSILESLADVQDAAKLAMSRPALSAAFPPLFDPKLISSTLIIKSILLSVFVSPIMSNMSYTIYRTRSIMLLHFADSILDGYKNILRLSLTHTPLPVLLSTPIQGYSMLYWLSPMINIQQLHLSHRQHSVRA